MADITYVWSVCAYYLSYLMRSTAILQYFLYASWISAENLNICVFFHFTDTEAKTGEHANGFFMKIRIEVIH